MLTFQIVSYDSNGYTAEYKYRVDKLVTRIVKHNSTSIRITKAKQMYVVAPGYNNAKEQNIYYNNSSTVIQQTFTLMSSHPGFYYTRKGDYDAITHGVGAEVSIDFSNGDYIDFHFGANPEGANQ